MHGHVVMCRVCVSLEFLCARLCSREPTSMAVIPIPQQCFVAPSAVVNELCILHVTRINRVSIRKALVVRHRGRKIAL